MTNILQIDASARPHSSAENPFGSHSRRLGKRFALAWRAAYGNDGKIGSDENIVYRDVGQQPPQPVSGAWIHAAFTKPEQRLPWMSETLAESDTLIDELLAADIIVAGVPMYNFAPPAQFKAWIDNIVRVGRTFGFDRSRPGDPYWPLLAGADKTLVILSSRGDHGYGKDGRIAALNHVEASITTAFNYIGITDIRSVAIEFDEFADARLKASIEKAEAEVDALVETLIRERRQRHAA